MQKQKIVWITAAVVVVLVLGGAGLAFALRNNSDKTPTAAPAPSSAAPAPSATPPPSPGADITGPLDLLLLGSDNHVSWDDPKNRHADTVMIVHVPADRSRVYLVSLPRFGGRRNKLQNAARGVHGETRKKEVYR